MHGEFVDDDDYYREVDDTLSGQQGIKRRKTREDASEGRKRRGRCNRFLLQGQRSR